MGGGVIPAHHTSDLPKSPRISEDERKEQERKLSDELERTGEIQPKDVTPVPEPVPVNVTYRNLKNTNEVLVQKDTTSAAGDPVVPSLAPNDEPLGEAMGGAEEDVATTEMRDTTRDSTQSTSSLKAASDGEKDEVKRLSITIPGSFS
jgi:hypothetical protein